MINDNFHNMFVGGIIGTTQTIMGHPLDTLKTLNQNNIKINIKNRYNLVSLFKGIKYPLLINSIYNTSLFSLFELLNNDRSLFYSGFVAGFYSGIILSPFEYYKVNKQIGTKIKLSNNSNLFKGVFLTMFREGLASSVYFSTYFYLTEQKIPAFISGGCSGCLSWIITYPIDTVKTQYQSGQIDKFEVINKLSLNLILNKSTWNGISFCLARAFLVNSISFYLYDKINNIRSNNNFNSNSNYENNLNNIIN